MNSGIFFDHPILWIAGLSVLIVYGLLLFVFRGGFRRQGEPPFYESFIPYLGNAISFGRDPVAFIWAGAAAARAGIFTTVFKGRRMHFVSNPHYWSTILKFKESLSFDPIVDDISSNAFSIPRSETDKCIPAETHRTLVQHIQGSDAIADLTSRFNAHISTQLSEMPLKFTDGDLFSFVLNLLVPATAATLFGPDHLAHAPQIVDQFVTYDRKFPLLAAGFPNRFLKKAVDSFRALSQSVPLDTDRSRVAAVIAERNRYFESRGLEPTSRQFLSASILWAANGNTAPATFWTLYYIMRDPQLLARVRSELLSAQKEADTRTGVVNSPLGLEEMRRLPILEAVATEALRLHASVMLQREALENIHVQFPDNSEYELRKGDRLSLFPSVAHCDAEIYPEPHVFKWDRFYSPDGTPKKFYKDGKEIPRSVCWMPFGGGLHMCPGRFFAFNEIKLITALILRHFDLELDSAAPAPTPDRNRVGAGVQPPVLPLRIRYRLRQSSSPPS